jgi:hypothetical protein
MTTGISGCGYVGAGGWGSGGTQERGRRGGAQAEHSAHHTRPYSYAADGMGYQPRHTVLWQKLVENEVHVHHGAVRPPQAAIAGHLGRDVREGQQTTERAAPRLWARDSGGGGARGGGGRRVCGGRARCTHNHSQTTQSQTPSPPPPHHMHTLAPHPSPHPPLPEISAEHSLGTAHSHVHTHAHTPTSKCRIITCPKAS